MTSLHRLALEIGVSERTLRRALRSELIRGGWSTPHRLSLPPGEPGYVSRSWDLLDALRRKLRPMHDVRLAVLFGPRAVDSRDDRGALQVLAAHDSRSGRRTDVIASRLAEAADRQVVVLSLDDPRADAALLLEVLRDGRVLLDRHLAWTRLKRRRGSLTLSLSVGELSTLRAGWRTSR